jgi:hypothetical protein
MSYFNKGEKTLLGMATIALFTGVGGIAFIAAIVSAFG